MAKSTEAHIRASAKYYEQNNVRVSVALNRKTQSDVIDRFDSVDSKLGYIVNIVRSDVYRKNQHLLYLCNAVIKSDNTYKYDDLIDENIDRIKLDAGYEIWSRVADLFVDDTPNHVIVSELLRTIDRDISIDTVERVNQICIDDF